MSDPNPTPTPTPTPETTTPRTHAALNKKQAEELQLAEELLGVAQDEKYAETLAGEEIDADFTGNLAAQLVNAGQMVGTATGSRAGKISITKTEEGFKKALVAQLQTIQKRAKRKYPNAADPMRAKYFISQRIDANRGQLEGVTRSILTTLGADITSLSLKSPAAKNGGAKGQAKAAARPVKKAKLAADTLPGMKPGDVTSLIQALSNYVGVQTDQTDGQTDAVTAGKLLEAKVEEIAGLRKQIQYAADTIWPHTDPANAPIRKAFKLPANRSLK